ncbi:MAG: hypothetical protein HYX48_06390 [Chlamydiales bacterium]|nr:hypothetical protein [Chlamydiales bacterium]
MSKVLSCPECISNHTIMEHLFVSPLCEDQELLVKIAVVVFHILTFGVPLAVYHVIDCIFPASPAPRSDEKTRLTERLKEAALCSIQEERECGEICESAIAFARAELERLPDIAPFQFNKTHTPVNTEISRMYAMCNDVHSLAFHTALIKYTPETAWSQQEVLEAADAYIKVAYALAHLTIQDIPAFLEKLETQGIYWSSTRTLTEKDSYLNLTSQQLLFAYRHARTIWVITKGRLKPSENIPYAHAKPFYQPGTMQNRWRMLYNSYSLEVAIALRTSDGQGVEFLSHYSQNWSEPDTGVNSFELDPDAYSIKKQERRDV